MGLLQRIRLARARRRGGKAILNLDVREGLTMAQYRRVCELIHLDPDELLFADPTKAEQLKRSARCPRSPAEGHELLRLVYTNGGDVNLKLLTRDTYSVLLGFAAADFIYSSTRNWRPRLSALRGSAARTKSNLRRVEAVRAA